MEIAEICKIFGIDGEITDIVAIKTGNINKTYKVTVDGKREYIVQDINKFVFKSPEHIMANIDAVTRHISAKLGDGADRYVLDFLKTSDGKNYVIDDEDRFLRSYKFIPDSVTYDVFDDLRILTNVGGAFGRFQMQLSDFDAGSLYEIIPDFHNTEARYNALEGSAHEDKCSRLAECGDVYSFLMENRGIAQSLTDMLKNNELPLRVTHNDTKCNNVLFDTESGEPLAVIDLDTVMPGLTAYDFGDAVRSAASTSKEDETDLEAVGLDLDKYEAFAKGFVLQVADSLTEREIETLYLGPIVMALELSSRFLKDYLDGDLYFKCDHPLHNLHRARCQARLAQDMISKSEQAKKIIEKYARK